MIEIFKTLALQKEANIPLYVQLYNQVKALITDGTLPYGSKLPSIRQLSTALEINQVTVVSAFKQLQSEGYIQKKTGSGTFVADILSHQQNNHKFSMLADELYQYDDDISLISNGQIKISEQTVNFASATPTNDLFPVENFKVVLNEVLERDKGSAFSYQDSQGYYPLRQSISQFLYRSEPGFGIDNIQIISGAQQGLDIISKAFLKQGDFILSEIPTYTGAIAVFKSRGAQIVGIEMEEDGPNLNILQYNLEKYRPKLIYTIPSYQNPTGCSYSNEKRPKILELAEKYNAYIIEDDYISELDFENRNYASLKSLDKYNRVIFIKSFSKIFMPGLRLGFMIAPANLQGNILEAKHTTDISTSGLIQRSFDLYIRKGYWDKHLKFMYQIYRERYLKTIDALKANLPDSVHYTSPGGGLNIWLSMPYGFLVNELFKLAASNNVVFAPGRIFYSNSQAPLNNLRLSFAAVYIDQIEFGIEKLCECMNILLKKQLQHRSIPML